MMFGGLQKHSFIDYPGKISCVFFVSGCNFDCPYCHNPDLVQDCSRALPAALTEEEAYRFLEMRRGILDGVVISGGEPTLREELPSVCRRIHELGFPVKLDTNGSRPRVLQRLIEEELVDYIAMDIKTDPEQYASHIVRGVDPDVIRSSIRIIMDGAIPYEFRTTCVKPMVDPETIDNISCLIDGAMCYALQRFSDVRVLHPEFFQGSPRACDMDEMTHMKTIASKRVRKCLIR
ncbi:MAG: anaerobic ribonucleoside-triphosphate reductase activating protein [Desulfobacterales bacterium]|nr:anaerobic ribonucleoside-triphosphate reductase activating protein [Desulfobacterales bacterium]